MMLYPDFLENEVSYDAAQAMWADRLDTLAVQYNFSYALYLNESLANGEKDRDGNPIFNAWIPSINRGVSISQEVPEGEDLYIQGYLDRIEDFDGLPDFDELVIDLVLSEETKAIAETWIHAWLVEQVDKGTMDKLLDEQMILVSE